MKVIFCSEGADVAAWRHCLEARVPGLQLYAWPEIGDGAEMRYALLWRPPEELFAAVPNLEAIFSLGAGVDHLWACRSLPSNVPVVRLADAGMGSQIVEYALYGVLHYHRHFDLYRRDQEARLWQPRQIIPAAQRGVGILGMGVLGRRLAVTLETLGFAVAGWGRGPRSDLPWSYFHGEQGLKAFLARSDILVCLLPLTEQTRGLIDRDFLATLPRGACLINCGRGAQLIERDLLEALSSGQIRGAMLDVLNREPAEPDNPLWSQSGVSLTPHIAAQTLVEPACAQIAENILRHREGLPLLHRVDPKSGY